MTMKKNKQLYGTYIIILSLLLAAEIPADVISFITPYHCLVDTSVQHDPWWTSIQYEKQAYCKHAFVIANTSDVRLLYSFIDANPTSSVDQPFYYEIIAPSSFAEYAWQQQSARVSNSFSEWDPGFDRSNVKPPADPAAPTIGDRYLIISLTEVDLKKTLETAMKTKNWNTNFPAAIVIKIVASQTAQNADSALSTITITNNKFTTDSITFTSGSQSRKALQTSKLSKVVPQKHLLL